MPKANATLSGYDPYYYFTPYFLRIGKMRPCGRNMHHGIRRVNPESTAPAVYEVSYYVPGYGTDKIRQYRSLSAAKAAITKYDKFYF